MSGSTARIALISTLCLMSSGALAGSLNYNYAEVGVRFSDYGRPDGFGLGGLFSADLMPSPHLRFLGGASYDDLSDPDGSVWNLMAGLGVILPIQSNFHVVIDAAAVYNDIDIDVPTPFGDVNVEDDDFGPRLSGLARFQVAPKVELQGGLNYLDLYDDSELGINLGAYLTLSSGLAGFVRYDEESDVETVTLGARFDF